MTDDQHRVGVITKARILVADTLERHAAKPRDPADVAAWLLEQLQDYGWRPPLDLTETPPLRPANATTDGPGYQAFADAKAALAARRGHPGK